MKKIPRIKESEFVEEMNHLIAGMNHHLIQYQENYAELRLRLKIYAEVYGDVTNALNRLAPQIPFSQFRARELSGRTVADAAYSFMEQNHIEEMSVRDLWQELSIRGIRSISQNPRAPLTTALERDDRFERVDGMRNTFRRLQT